MDSFRRGLMFRGWTAALWLLLITGLAGTAAAAQQKLTHVTVALGDVSLNKLIFIVAQDAGLYKKNGLEVDQYITPGAAEVVRHSGVNVPNEHIRLAAVEEAADFSIGGGTPVMVNIVTNARAEDRIILASTDNMVRWNIVARPGISRPQDLKGKKIGYSGIGGMSHFMALWYVKHMGWDAVMDVSLLSNALALDTLQSGRVDAFVADEIAYTMAVSAGYKSLVDLSQFNAPIAGSGAYASRQWVANNRDTVRRFIRATVEAIALIKQNKDVGLKAIAGWYGITDREKQEMLLHDVASLPRKPYPAVEGIKLTMQLYDSHEMRSHKPEDFYDSSFVRELDQSGFVDSLYK